VNSSSRSVFATTSISIAGTIDGSAGSASGATGGASPQSSDFDGASGQVIGGTNGYYYGLWSAGGGGGDGAGGAGGPAQDVEDGTFLPFGLHQVSIIPMIR